jgi:hypothetical protein
MKFKFNKFVRQNSRTLLMVVMSLLLVAFLIPQSISGMSRRDGSERKVGELYGRAVTSASLRAAASDLQLLADLRYLERVPEGFVLNLCLLLEEARHAGVRAGADAVKEDLVQRGVSDAVLQAVSEGRGRSYPEIYETIGRWLGLQHLLSAQAAAAGTSLPRAELAYRDRTQEAVADISVINARAFVHLVPEPSEEELAKFFDEGKERTTAHTEKDVVFGYRYPDRVQIEYLTVDPNKIDTRRIRIRPADVRRHFDENANYYTKPDPQATQAVAGRPPARVRMTFEEAEEQVREDLRRQRAVEAAQTIVNEMYDEAHRPWATSALDANGFAEEPKEGVVSFAELKQKHSGEYEVDYDKTDLVDAEGLKAAAPNVCGATYTVGRGYVRGGELAMRVEGLVEKDPRDGVPVFNVGEPMPVVLARTYDRTGKPFARQAYLFRVIRAERSAAPASSDEIRPRLIEDWKLRQAFELAHKQADALAARAQEVGLTAAAGEAKELLALLEVADQATSQTALEPRPAEQYAQELTPSQPPQLTRSTSMVGRLGRVSDVQKAIFALADEPRTETSPARRVTTVPVAKQFKYVVAELLEIKPIYAGAFSKELAQAGPEEARDETYAFSRGWFAMDSIKLRTGFKEAPPPTTQRSAPVTPP